MDVVVRSRRTTVGERFRSCAQDKLDRLARLDQGASRVEVEVSEEHNPRQSAGRVHVELTYHGRGAALRAVAAATDAFAALDIAVDKLGQQLRRVVDRRRVHHGVRTPTSVAAATSRSAAAERAIMNGDGDEP
jgi:ribosomal subunit interface protein